jgi:hypothetical protein
MKKAVLTTNGMRALKKVFAGAGKKAYKRDSSRDYNKAYNKAYSRAFLIRRGG